ncbi:nuclease-related domain-containing protein [Sporosarcina sp. FSL W8-0480]|uniref:nuclease-related domain-containing protein n=1 Tax=Sporosarcina sp. FSL W8-0480 TaxID=2954701 RepID=UPI0030DB43E0
MDRLPINHPKYESISKKYHQAKAGYAGELYVDRVLNEVSYPQGVNVLKDVSLEINPHFRIQIDTLIISPNLIFLLEIKNYVGTVHFDEDTGKTTKVSSHGRVDKYDCIIHQIDRATNGLLEWLRKRNINIPIEAILVMSNTQTDIPVFPENVTLKYAKQLPRYIRNLLPPRDQQDENQVRSIVNQINSQRINWPSMPACHRYAIDPNDLKRGVHCTTCNIAMARKRGHSWVCMTCRKKDSNALWKSIEDWFILIEPKITNKQLRLFLELASNSSASVIFRDLKLQRNGVPPHTFYTMGNRQLDLMKSANHLHDLNSFVR